MRLQHCPGVRRGTLVPFLAFALLALCGFVALAIDVGMVMVAKTQCQNAADAAAAAGARTLDGTSTGNTTNATANAKSAAKTNQVLSQNVQDADLTVVQHGSYHYDSTTQTFYPQFPPVSPDNYNLTQVTIQHSSPTAFARAFRIASFAVQATAIAAHRPRDVTIVLDFSGSMNNESDLWNCETYLGSLINTSNNTDTVYPQYGWYNTSTSPLATIQGISNSVDSRTGRCNITQTVLGVSPIANDYYQNSRGASSAVAAFYPAVYPGTGTLITNTVPAGDIPLMKNGSSTTPALTWQDITGSATTYFKGYVNAKPTNYTSNSNKFYGWTRGPGYWGQTFYMWPPDPSVDATTGTNDWRKKFFFLSNGTTPLNDNTKLFGSNGVLNDPSGNYVINYQAILAWISANCIQQTANDGRPFPPKLRAGGILFYDGVPTDVPSGAYTWTSHNDSITDTNQRFWKEYIDFVLGVWHDPFGNIQRPANPSCSYGGDFTAGSSTGGQYVSISGPDRSSTPDGFGQPFMSPTDNPKRPRHRFWFGPMTMIQFMSDTGLLPATTHDQSMIAARLGIQGALTDIQNNHPNDLVSMILFARPSFSGEPSEVGSFDAALTNLSRQYSTMSNSLYFPPNSGTSDVRPWDANGLQTPRPHGDYCSNTATSYGLMLAYNQFSNNANLQTQAVGGLGRKGAQRLVVLETDGMANVSTNATFTSSVSANSSYYALPPLGTISLGGADSGTEAESIATRICALTSDTTNGPGFATPRKSVIIHCVAFGAIFEPTAQDGQSATAMTMLQTISQIGGTGFPSSVTDTSSPYYYKLCIGTLSQRQSKLQQAFTTIMDDGAAIVLVQ